MPYLVRKIEAAKWRQNDILNGAPVSADAITSDKTSSNALSTWRIEGEARLDDAVIAIASNQQHLDTIDIVLLPEDAIAEAGLSLNSTPGLTPVADLVTTHRDIVSLNYPKLGALAQVIVQSFAASRVKRVRRSELIALLRGAVLSGRLDGDALAPDVRSKVCVMG